MKRGERLKKRRIELGLTMRETAELLGISVSGVQNLEKNQVMPNLKLGMAISHVYKKSLQWVVDGTDNIENKIPIIGNTQTGPIIDYKNCDLDNNLHEFIRISSHGKNLYGLRVVGDTTNMQYSEGDILIIDSAMEPIVGEDIFIKFKSEQFVIKRLARFDNENIYLDSLNENYKRIVRQKNEIEFIHTIIGSIKSFMVESTG